MFEEKFTESWLATECYGPGFPDCWTSRINGEEINRGLGDKVAAICAYRDHRVKRWCFGWVLDLRTIQLSSTIRNYPIDQLFSY